MKLRHVRTHFIVSEQRLLALHLTDTWDDWQNEIITINSKEDKTKGRDRVWRSYSPSHTEYVLFLCLVRSLRHSFISSTPSRLTCAGRRRDINTLLTHHTQQWTNVYTQRRRRRRNSKKKYLEDDGVETELLLTFKLFFSPCISLEGQRIDFWSPIIEEFLLAEFSCSFSFSLYSWILLYALCTRNYNPKQIIVNNY